MRPILLTLFLVLLPFSAALSQTVIYTLTDPGRSPAFVSDAIACAGDVDGDGVNDIITGLPDAEESFNPVGRVRIYSGSSTATSPILFTFFGSANLGRFGASVDGLGDVNNDGFGDIVVGAPGAFASGSPGQVQVYSGADGSVLFSFVGDSAGDRLGVAVAGVGDVNADGTPDVAAGAPGDTIGSVSGFVRIYSGVDGTVLYTFTGVGLGDSFGQAVAGAGDVDGDGFDDVIAGNEQDLTNGFQSGRAQVFSGANGSVLYTIFGDDADDQFGKSVAGAGDVNGDGYDDFIVGAPGDDDGAFNAGSARVYSGADGLVLHTFSGANFLDNLGWSVDGAGDVDGDGLSDLLVGVPGFDINLFGDGQVLVYSGANGALLTTVNGRTHSASFGTVVAGCGDLDGDGLADVLGGERVVAYTFQSFNSLIVPYGSAHSGLSGSQLPLGEGIAHDNFGDSVSSAGDVDADGVVDFIVGSPFANSAPVVPGYTSAPKGLATIHSGADGTAILALVSDWVVDEFGASVAGVGDLNGDGADDVLVGASRGINEYGRAQVYSGADGSVIYNFLSNDYLGQFGKSVASAGDLDADGVGDFIIGAPGVGADIGLVEVYSGADGSVLFSFGGASLERLGDSVAGVGDVDGDGTPDIAATFQTYSGSILSLNIRVFSGASGALLHTIIGNFATGTVPGQTFQSSVAGAGDVDGDGLDDLILGDSFANIAQVFAGADGSVLYTIFGDHASDKFGHSVAGAGDVNGDGFDDFVVGAMLDDDGGLDAGSVRVYSGADGSVLHRVDGGPGDHLGSSVSTAGDVNGGGVPDLIVGAPRAQGEVGTALVVLLPELAYSKYYTGSGLPHVLDLDWIPDNDDPLSVTGTLTCTGATPGALGLYVVSLAPIDFPAFGYLPLVVAIDPINLLDSQNFGFSLSGDLVLPGASRQIAFLAGTNIYLQFFESSPVIGSSNGLRIKISP